MGKTAMLEQLTIPKKKITVPMEAAVAVSEVITGRTIWPKCMSIQIAPLIRPFGQ